MIDILIAGAGPTGLTAAVEAKRQGLTVRIMERKSERQTTQSRAIVVHSRIMELMSSFSGGTLTKELQQAGIQMESIDVYFNQKQTPSSNLYIGKEAHWGDAQFPFALFLPQYDTERLLEDELRRLGQEVEWSKSLTSIQQDENFVVSTITASDGKEEKVTSRYVIGCDGGRSKTRQEIGIELDRKSCNISFIVADVHVKSHWMQEYKNRLFFPRDNAQIIFFTLGDKDHTYRIYAPADDGLMREDLTESYLKDMVVSRTGFDLDFELAGWLTMFEITHGLTTSFRSNRVFLAGDASHVHSPVGGQGMNTGMMDAMNLVWKLAWAERCRKQGGGNADIETILDSYNAERYAQGKDLLKMVEPSTIFLSSQNFFIRILRRFLLTWIVPLLVPRNIRAVSQLEIKYFNKTSTIVAPHVSRKFVCQPGERLPNLKLADGSRLYDYMDRNSHHFWVVLSPDPTAPAITVDDAGVKGLKTIEVGLAADQSQPPKISATALEEPQAILVRPDLYVASIGSTVDAVWEEMGQLLGNCALSSM